MAWNPKDSPYQDSFVYQDPFNTGIGNFYGDMNNWRDMTTGQRLGADGAAFLQDANKNGIDMNAASTEDPNYQRMLQAMHSYTYKGDDGKNYMIGGNYNRGGPTDQEAAASSKYDLAFGGVVDGAGRKPGEMSYSTTQFKPDWGGDMGAYNGSAFDFYDKNGKYVGGNVPTSLGDDQFAKTTAAMIAMVALPALAAYMAPAAGAATTGAGFVGEGAASGVGAWDAALASTPSWTAGAGAAAPAAAAGDAVSGNGAFLGEGVQSGVPAWDGAAGAGAGAPVAGSGGSVGSGGAVGSASTPNPVTGTPPPANPNSIGWSGLFNGQGINGGLQAFMPSADAMQYALPILGALSGSKGQEVTKTETKELPDFLREPVAGQNGLVPNAQWLMQQQLQNPGLLKSPKNRKKPNERRGLL
jgi:hypothetical protein